MKKLLFTAFCLLFPFFIDAQTVAVAADKMNLFYLGVDNPVELAVEGVANEKLKVSTNNGEIIKLGNGKYNARPQNIGECAITVEWDGQKVVKKFRVKPVPDPIVMGDKSTIKGPEIGGTSPIAVSKGLKATLDEFDFDAKCVITSFTCAFIYKKGENYEINVNGASSPEYERLSLALKSGDKVVYSKIRAKCEGDIAPRVLYGELSRTIK